MTVVIDPFLIAMPAGQVDPRAVRAYAERALDWSGLLGTAAHDLVVSSRAMSVVYRLELDPHPARLARLFATFGIDEYSAVDIAAAFGPVISNSPQMEQRSGGDCVECIAGTEVVVPDQIRRRMHPEVGTAFLRAAVATSHALRVLEESTWSLGTAPLTEEGLGERMTVQGLVQDGSLKKPVLGNWPLIFDPATLRKSARIIEVFEANPVRATKLAWSKVSYKVPAVQDVDCSGLRFGPRFLDSLNQPRFLKRPSYERDLERVFEAIVYVLVHLWSFPGDKYHPLRETVRNRDSAQKTRERRDEQGTAWTEKAVRVEVIAGTRPLHLHGWHCFDGTYEWSNVTDDHDDATIYE